MKKFPYRKTKSFFRAFAKDEDGVMMTEYVIILSMLVVATIWLNKSADTLLFGADPNQRTGNPQMTDDVINAESGIDGLAKQRMLEIRNEKKRAYLSQVYIHLSRP
ncbi:MAG TPA: hypothetical protein PKD58_05110 [Candidatus Sumerlaeota bacterium]|nr:hypothetical protein [Candidatus Sumerlaeota bacterium]HMX62425.1 hypothetical protein [Candidatus Sumerlaeota bacterium]